MKLERTRASSLTKRVMCGSTLSLALLGGGSAWAAQPWPSEAPGLETAIAVSSKWLSRADANQADAMWKASGPSMQQNVTQADWVKHIGDIRNQLGSERWRTWMAANKAKNPNGVPDGHYLVLTYATQFEKVAAVETVSLVKNGSKWQPVGYEVRVEQPSQAKQDASAQP
jgi:hypothetical protein